MVDWGLGASDLDWSFCPNFWTRKDGCPSSHFPWTNRTVARRLSRPLAPWSKSDELPSRRNIHLYFNGLAGHFLPWKLRGDGSDRDSDKNCLLSKQGDLAYLERSPETGWAFIFCAQSQVRTDDPSLFRGMLYQLSYLGLIYFGAFLSGAKILSAPTKICLYKSIVWLIAGWK